MTRVVCTFIAVAISGLVSCDHVMAQYFSSPYCSPPCYGPVYYGSSCYGYSHFNNCYQGPGCHRPYPCYQDHFYRGCNPCYNNYYSPYYNQNCRPAFYYPPGYWCPCNNCGMGPGYSNCQCTVTYNATTKEWTVKENQACKSWSCYCEIKSDPPSKTLQDCDNVESPDANQFNVRIMGANGNTLGHYKFAQTGTGDNPIILYHEDDSFGGHGWKITATHDPAGTQVHSIWARQIDQPWVEIYTHIPFSNVNYINPMGGEVKAQEWTINVERY